MRNRVFAALFLTLLAAGSARAAEAPTKDKTKAPEHKITQFASYMMVDPIYTINVGDTRAAGLLMVGVGLDVPNPELRAVVDRSMPELRDAYVRSLMTFTTANVRTDARPDVSAIAERLQAVTDRALIEQCKRLSGANPRLYDLQLSRIGYFEQHPPSEDWDGSFRPILK